MNLDLKGKHALVCGGSDGLGFASANEMSLLGANVTLLARTEEKLKAAVGQLDTSKGQRHQFRSVDTADLDNIEVTAKELVSHSPIHILVNNTGGPAPGNILDEDPDKFINAFKQHVMAAQILSKAVIPGMRQHNYGRIINIISTSVRQPISILAVSNTIRGSMASWAKTMSLELAADQITVNNLLPGTIDTSRIRAIIKQQMEVTGKTKEELITNFEKDIPMHRIGVPEEFGAVVAFIASPAASYITGTSIPVDGGKIKSI